MNKYFVLLILLLKPFMSCYGDAIGVADYQVTHDPLNNKLHVKAEFDVQGHTYMKFPAQFIQSDIELMVENLDISIDKSRIKRNGLELNFDSPRKEHVIVTYTLKNESASSKYAYRNPYTEKNGFYFNSHFLIQPNTQISDGNLLLQAKIKFNTKVSDIIFSTSGQFTTGTYTPLDLILDTKTMTSAMRYTYYIASSNQLLKISQINIDDKPMTLLFFKIPEANIQPLITQVQKIYSAEHKFFGPITQNNKQPPFTLFINSDHVHDYGHGAENIEGSIIYILNNKSYHDTILAHEYIHNWINNICDSPSQMFINSWFIEGFTEYYAWKTAFITDILNSSSILENTNFYFANLNLSPTRYKSYLELGSARYTFQIFYQKGFFLASELDQQIIKATAGKYSLDDVMSSLIKKFQSGTKFNKELLKDEIKKLADSSFDDIFKAIEYGENFTPTSTPFGIKTKFKYFTFYTPKYGFDLGSSVITQKVTKVDKSSSAYKAGLRDGDFFPRDRNQGSAEPHPGPQTVTFIVGTDSGEKTITYTTESEKTVVPQYELLE